MNTPPTPVPPTNPMPGRKRPPGNTGQTLLGVIGIVAGGIVLLAILAALAFFLGRKNNGKEDHSEDSIEQTSVGFTEEETVTIDDTTPRKDLTVDEPTPTHLYLPPKTYHAMGYLSDLPCSIDFTVNNNGDVSGTFWNIFYDIKLQVEGSIDSAGNLSLDLGSGSTLSHMDLKGISGSNRFSGSWGKNQKPISIKVYPGSRDSSLPSQSGVSFKIVGGGMTTHGHISSVGGDRYKLTFDNQPEVNALPCTLSGSTFSIYSPDNSSRVAYFTLPGESIHSSGTSTIYICNGNEFDITLL